jgi:hypothetical protein
MSTAALRNLAIVLAITAAVFFLPGGGDAAAIIGGLLSTAILVCLVMLVARFYRERRMDIVSLGDRWRALLYGSVGLIVLAMAALPRLSDTGGGIFLWFGAVAAAFFTLYRVWRHHREYG